ncbi:hypothetical protein R6Q59_036964 [Mikania micrantha]
MVKAIRIHEHGGPEVMKLEDVELGELKTGEIKVKNIAIGVNFVDLYMRSSPSENYPQPLPFTPGMEASGVVIEVGPEVSSCKVGDVVAYAGLPLGAYTEEQVLPAERVLQVPPSVDPKIAAAILFKGLTAHILLRQVFKVGPGHTILCHAAVGGVGTLACQWANVLGATVIGTVSTKEKAILAKQNGCHHVINYKEENFVDRVMEITSGKGVDAVYDSVGKDTFKGSLACVKNRGYLVLFGTTSGDPELTFKDLNKKSVVFTIPGIFIYTEDRNNLVAASEEVFSYIEKGVLRVQVSQYPLSQAMQAHLDLHNRRTTGSIVLVPDN